ncbi:AAA family ATPase [Kitasatospora sp. MBT63]|uniref:AAA family ATPase n=1 Tax=Kitasatospora sp. MBT63 TaxID=1444768 RepID=UPI0009EB81B5|nr:LuxR family transcriptional regulator [Kitasatospora sp. MBT63]
MSDSLFTGGDDPLGGTPPSVGRAGWRGGFVGRTDELAAIERCRAAAVAGVPWVVVVEGPSGIGKTALARRALEDRGDGLQVCWASCDATEKDLPYAALDQLLRRMPCDVPGLRELLRELTPDASPLAVGTDLLPLLAVAADSAPLALVLDDVSWADDHSRQALAFSLRRLWSEPVLIIATVRTGGALGPPVDGEHDWRSLWKGVQHLLPLHLGGLTEQDAGGLAREAGAPELSRAALRRLQERTGGHPLHLRTLLSEVPPPALMDLSHPLPVPSSLESVIGQTLRRLPHDARRLAEALAVLDLPAPLTTAGDLAGLTDPTSALAPLLTAGLVEWDPLQPTAPVRIRHRLQRDAVYHAISPSRRSSLHSAAVTLVAPDAAWSHRVAATTRTDPGLAARLDAEADRQAAHGLPGRAATLLLWAADLSTSRDQSEQRLLAAVMHLLTGQLHGRAAALRRAVEGCASSPRRDVILGSCACHVGDLDTAEHHLTRAAATATDPATAAVADLSLGVTRILRGDGVGAAAVLRPMVDQECSTVFARDALGMLAFAVGHTDGPVAGLDVLAPARLPAAAAVVPRTESHCLLYRGILRVLAGQLRAGGDDLTTLVTRQHSAGDVSVEPTPSAYAGLAHYFTGRWEEAVTRAEAAVLTADTDGSPWGLSMGHAAAALSYAQQGHRKQAESHLASCRQHATVFPWLNSLHPPVIAATLAQARGDRPAMIRALRAVEDPGVTAPGLLTVGPLLWAPLLVDAFTAGADPAPGDVERAGDALARIDRLVVHAPGLALTSHWLHGRIAVATGDVPAALAEYHAADRCTASDDDIPLHRAFLHHDFARLLLSAAGSRNRRDAASHLEQAHRLFRVLGATPYLERVARDLADLGATDGDGPGRRLPDLTEREHAVARLAAQGLTNQEIARQLFLSPKTVEYHLGHVFTKLSLSTRRQLRTLLRP